MFRSILLIVITAVQFLASGCADKGDRSIPPANSTKLTKTLISKEFYQSSEFDDRASVPYTVFADNGWHVVKGTSKFNTADAKGDWNQVLLDEDSEKVKYSVTTICHHIGMFGRLHFTISFTEIKD